MSATPVPCTERLLWSERLASGFGLSSSQRACSPAWRSTQTRRCEAAKNDEAQPSSSEASSRAEQSQQAAESKSRTPSSRGRGGAQDERVWGTKPLSEMEAEILGISSKADAVSKPAAAPRGQGQRPRKNLPPRRNADGSEWSILDELDRGFQKQMEEREEWEIEKRARETGEWLEEKTKPSEEFSYLFGFVLLFGIFPLWLSLVLVAGGWVDLPEGLSTLQNLLRTQ